MKKILWITAICFCFVAIVFASTVSESVLRDGTGGSYYGKINKDNQLVVSAITDTRIHKASIKGDAYSWTVVSEDLAAAGTALCVVNTSKTRKLVIDSIYVWSDVATIVQVHSTANYTWTGTGVTGVNLNRTSDNVADANANANETGNTQGSIIIALHTNELTTDQFGIGYDLDGSVVLNYNQAIAVDLVSDSAAYQCTIVGYFID